MGKLLDTLIFFLYITIGISLILVLNPKVNCSPYFPEEAQCHTDRSVKAYLRGKSSLCRIFVELLPNSGMKPTEDVWELVKKELPNR